MTGMAVGPLTAVCSWELHPTRKKPMNEAIAIRDFLGMVSPYRGQGFLLRKPDWQWI